MVTLTSPCVQAVALPEDRAGIDVCILLVDAADMPVGSLTVACCRYGARVPAAKAQDQRVKVDLSQQFLENSQVTPATKGVRKAVQEAGLTRFVQLLVWTSF